MKKFNFKDSFKTRSFRAGGYSLITTVIVLVVVILVNVVAQALPTSITQIDVTFSKIYSISQQTKSLVGNLKEDITVYWIVREGYEDTVLEKILKDYDQLSDKLHVKQVDPNVDPTFLDKYSDNIYYDNSLIVQGEKRYRFVDFYDIYVQDENDVYNFDGENALTSAIDYCISQKLPKMYIITGHSEVELPAAYITQMRLENIDLVTLDLTEQDAIPEDADCLLVVTPTKDISAKEQAVLSDYLSDGGKMMLLTNVPIGDRLENLEGLMSVYGITVTPGIVLEGSSDNYMWGYNYYLRPNIDSHPITDPLMQNGSSVLLPLGQGLVVSDTLPENVEVKKILYTSSSAYCKELDAETSEREAGDPTGSFAVGVAVTDSSSGASIVWVTSGALTDSTTNTQINGGNMDMFLNSVNWLCDPDESGLTIRAKELSSEYLVINASSVSMLTVIVVGVIPGVYLLVGIVCWLRRKRK